MCVVVCVVYVRILSEYEDARITAMPVRGTGRYSCGVSVGHEYVGGTRGSGIVSSEADELGVSVVRGMRGVG